MSRELSEVAGFAMSYLEVRGYLYVSGVISPLVWVITIVILLITLLITTHELQVEGLLFVFGRSLRLRQHLRDRSRFFFQNLTAR